MNIIAQLFGVGAMAALFTAYQQKKRRGLIISKLCADVCWVIHYLCIGAYGGMIPNMVGIFRELVFVKRDESKWANCAVWPVLFILLNWGLGISTFKTAINILPITASTFVTISLWYRKPHITKIISFPVSAAFLIYDCFVGSYVGIANESIAMLSIILYFVKHIKRRAEKNG